MYLKLSVAGHLTIFLTRTRGPFWSIRPARILWIAVLGTQIIATLIAVFGVFMAPLGWKWAGFVWVYALLWALVNDRVKLLAYKIFDPVKAEPKPDAKAEVKPDAKGEPKPEAKDEPKPEAKADAPKPETKAEPKSEAKADAPKPEAKADEPKPDAKADAPKPETKAEPKSDAKADEPKPDAKADEPKPEDKADEPKPDAKADAPKPEAKADEPKPDAKAEPKSGAKADEPKPEAKDKTQSDVSPQLVKRVHELYEELGREDVQTVQDWEKAEPERQKTESHK
jgi:H+-transporting ATPase